MGECITCMECGRPWGVILNRGEEPTTEAAAKARADMVELWRKQAECDHDEGTVFDTDKLPEVGPVRIVYISEGTWRFVEQVTGDCFVEPGWWDVDWCEGVPAWIVAKCKQRWAYRWDCCEIGWSERFVLVGANAGRDGGGAVDGG